MKVNRHSLCMKGLRNASATTSFKGENKGTSIMYNIVTGEIRCDIIDLKSEKPEVHIDEVLITVEKEHCSMVYIAEMIYKQLTKMQIYDDVLSFQLNEKGLRL